MLIFIFIVGNRDTKNDIFSCVVILTQHKFYQTASSTTMNFMCLVRRSLPPNCHIIFEMFKKTIESRTKSIKPVPDRT